MQEERDGTPLASPGLAEPSSGPITGAAPWQPGLVSVIVVTYNNQALTRHCIESIYQRTEYPDLEVVVVDNASTDGTRELLEHCRLRYTGFKVVLNENNLGYVKAINLGIRSSSGEYLVLLNNDTIVTSGLIRGLVGYLQDKEIGCVGPVTNSVANEARIDVPYTELDELEEFAADNAAEHRGEWFEIKTFALYCAALRRQVIEQVGYLDERFEIGMFEDDDYSLTLWHNGYKIVCARDLYVHHVGRASFSKLPFEEYLRVFDENRRKLEEKWSITWERHIHSAPDHEEGELAGLQKAVGSARQTARERRPWALSQAVTTAEVVLRRLEKAHQTSDHLRAELAMQRSTCRQLEEERDRLLAQLHDRQEEVERLKSSLKQATGALGRAFEGLVGELRSRHTSET